MADILHRIGVATTSPDRVYDALTTVDGLAAWWTEDTKSAGSGGAPGDVIAFRFPPVGGFDMEVLEAVRDQRVLWRVTDGPEEWVGTTVAFDLHQDDDWTIVLFKHEGWREPVEFMHHCSTKWGQFLMSLKDHVETGTGAPAPHDVQVSNWH